MAIFGLSCGLCWGFEADPAKVEDFGDEELLVRCATASLNSRGNWPGAEAVANHEGTSSPLAFARAKRMRREPTEAERRLWSALRAKRLGNLKFFRQVPVGPYIVDFLNQEHGVVVEVDGATHGEAREAAHDKRRTAYLGALGLAVHRVDNIEVFRNLGDVWTGSMPSFWDASPRDLIRHAGACHPPRRRRDEDKTPQTAALTPPLRSS